MTDWKETKAWLIAHGFAARDEALDDGHGVGEGLARARRGAYEQVIALEQRRDRVLLHGRHRDLLHPIR